MRATKLVRVPNSIDGLSRKLLYNDNSLKSFYFIRHECLYPHCLGRNDLARLVRLSVRFDLCKLGARRASAGVNSGRERVTGTRELQWGI